MSSPSFEFNVLTTTGSTPDFTVVSFEGSEGLSKLYEYVIELKTPTSSTTSATFLDDLLDGDPEFKIIYGSEEYPVYGMLADFTEKYSAANYTYYTATLVPRLWQLTLSRDSKVYNDPAEDTVLEILTSMLGKYNLDYVVGDVNGDLLERDYRCQFNETDFSFISRLLENEGIFYYFDHSDGTDKIVFSNGVANTDGFSSSSEVPFDASPPANTLYDSINSWSCRKKRLPANLSMESYHPETPSINPSGDYDISASLVGEQYIFGENIHDDVEGTYLAQIRAEEFSINTTKYYGESGVCGLRSGYSFSLINHPNTTYNKTTDYVVTEVIHRGTFLDSSASVTSIGGIQSAISGSGNNASDSSPLYVNSFVAIDSEEQYRPARITPKPGFHGTLAAVVYSETKGEYAELDEQGRYRVLLPFRGNASTDDAERVSHWIRMSQPYAGGITKDGTWQAEGVFYPLMDNTEVLLTFVNGDLDRPIISGVVPNKLAPPLLDSTNSNQTIYSTHGMLVNDVRGGTSTKILVEDWEFVDDTFAFDEYEQAQEAAGGTRFSNKGNPLDTNDGKHHIKMTYGDQYNYTEGNIYSWGADFSIGFGNDYEEVHESEVQIEGEHFNMTSAMRSLGSTLKEYDYATNSEIAKDYSGWEDGQDGLVEKNWGDKCEYHFGRAFNWSGGTGPGGSLQSFNYGNGYTENLLACSGGTAGTNGLSTLHDSYSSYGIDPEKSTIEKTFGDTYSYHNGFSAEVRVGNSESFVDGNSKETITGNSDTKVTGATSSMFMGAESEMYISTKSEICVGANSNLALAASSEIKLGASSDLSFGLAFELFLGAKTEIDISAAFEIAAGPKMSLAAGGRFEVDATTKIETVGGLVAEANATAIKNGSLSMSSMALSMMGGALHIIS